MVMEFLGKLYERKDQALASLIGELMASDYFMTAVEKVVSTGGFVDQRIQGALNTFRVASRREVEDLEERLVRLERKMTRIVTAVEELKEKVESKGKKLPEPAKKLEGVCDTCGKTFTRKTVNQRFCSATCRVAAAPQ